MSNTTKPPKTSPAPPTPPTTPMTVAIAEELRKALEFDPIGVEALLPSVNYTWKAQDVTVEGCFHYVMLRDGVPCFPQLLDLMLERIPYFCLTRKDRKSFTEKFDDTRDLGHMVKMLQKAKRLLIRSKGSVKMLGEPGEMILFMLMEGVLKAPQMACKMFLKTSEEMPIHGADGTHLKYDPATDTMSVYWGESKLYQQLSTALDKVCESITEFTTNKNGKTPKDRDVAILCDHMNVDDDVTREAIAKYFNPYEPAFKNMREVFSCFVGFDYSYFDKLKKVAKDKAEDEFKKEYLSRVGEACRLFEDKIKTNNMHTLRFHLFLIPFESVEKFREDYISKL
jgi:hypothetical protein